MDPNDPRLKPIGSSNVEPSPLHFEGSGSDLGNSMMIVHFQLINIFRLQTQERSQSIRTITTLFLFSKVLRNCLVRDAFDAC